MRRTLVNLLRAACIFVCIAAIVMWIRSYHVADGIAWQRADGSEREVVSYVGGIHIRQLNPSYVVAPAQTLRRTIREEVAAGANWQKRAGGFTDHVSWERAGFVMFAGHTQVLTLTGSNTYNWNGAVGGYPTVNGSGTLLTNGATIVPVTNTTLITSGSTPVIASGTLTLGSGVKLNTAFGGSTTIFPGISMQLLVVIPFWFIVLLSALFGAAPLLRVPALIRVNRRRKRGLCERCGYDLRACGERCAECGYRRDQE